MLSFLCLVQNFLPNFVFMNGKLEECKAVRSDQTRSCISCHKGSFNTDGSASAERIKQKRIPFLKTSLPGASEKNWWSKVLTHYSLCLTCSVVSVWKVSSCKINVPTYKVSVYMKMENNVRIIPVNVRSVAVKVLSHSLNNCIFEPKGCKVAVTYPAAVRNCLCDWERHIRIQPVFPRKGQWVFVKLIRAGQLLCSVNKNQKSCGAACPHGKAISDFKVSWKLNTAWRCSYVCCSCFDCFFFNQIVLVCRSRCKENHLKASLTSSSLYE